VTGDAAYRKHAGGGPSHGHIVSKFIFGSGTNKQRIHNLVYCVRLCNIHLYSAGRPSRWALAHILVRHTLGHADS